jgi:hypothetical protein
VLFIQGKRPDIFVVNSFGSGFQVKQMLIFFLFTAGLVVSNETRSGTHLTMIWILMIAVVLVIILHLAILFFSPVCLPEI